MDEEGRGSRGQAAAAGRGMRRVETPAQMFSQDESVAAGMVMIMMSSMSPTRVEASSGPRARRSRGTANG